jgi:hypothetical protein
VALSWELRALTSIADLFIEMTHAEVGLQHYRRATRLFAAAVVLSRALNTPVPAELYESITAPIRAELSEGTFQAEWVAGTAMPLEQAVAFGAQEGDGE